MNSRALFIQQIETVLGTFVALRQQSPHDDLSGGASDDEITRFNTRAVAVVQRIAGQKSPYWEECDRILRAKTWIGMRAMHLAGVLQSLLDDIRDGFLEAARELIHGELFGDFLEMAAHLLDEDYKDAAAVVAGTSLETHLKQVAAKLKVSTEHTGAGGSRPKKTDALNAELASAGAYSKLDQKNVTAWLDLRNKAAHGEYSSYDKAQVGLLIASVRDFIARVPA